jgi:CBS domain-containing protein
VPVIDDGKLVGIVSRANLVRALATGKGGATTSVDLREKTWVNFPRPTSRARIGSRTLWFSEEQPEEERLAFRIAVDNIPSLEVSNGTSWHNPGAAQ